MLQKMPIFRAKICGCWFGEKKSRLTSKVCIESSSTLLWDGRKSKFICSEKSVFLETYAIYVERYSFLGKLKLIYTASIIVILLVSVDPKIEVGGLLLLIP